MKFKLKRIDWYIIKQFLGTYIFAIALIIAISVVFDINEKIDQVPESGRTVESDCLRLLHDISSRISRTCSVRCLLSLPLSSSPQS